MKISQMIEKYQSIHVFNQASRYYDDTINAWQDDLNHGCYVEAHDPDRDSLIDEAYEELEKNNELLNALTYDSLYGPLYTNGTIEEKEVLEKLVELEAKQEDCEFPVLRESTSLKLMELLVKHHAVIAETPINVRSLETLFKIGTYIDKNLISFEDEQYDFVYHIDMEAEISSYVENNRSNISFDKLYFWILTRNMTIVTAKEGFKDVQLITFKSAS